MLAYCGLRCDTCPNYFDTWEDVWIKEGSATQSKAKEINLQSKNTSCQGCLSEDGQKTDYCSRCRIRECARKKKFDTCADCSVFENCLNLAEIFTAVPEAAIRLSKLRVVRGPSLDL